MYGENKEINNKEDYKNVEYFLKVPISILHDKDLNNTEKILLMIICNLSKANGVCFASNKTLAELHNSSNPTISRCVKSLEDKGYIRSELIRDEKTNLVKKRNIYLTKKGSPKMITRLSKNEIGLSKNDNYNKINNNKIINNKIDHDISINTIKDKWNSIEELNSIEAITDKRYQDVSYLIKTYGLEKILQAIDNIKNSQYLLGKLNSPPLKFDWFLIADNFVKVLENYYKNREDGTDSTLANNYSW